MPQEGMKECVLIQLADRHAVVPLGMDIYLLSQPDSAWKGELRGGWIEEWEEREDLSSNLTLNGMQECVSRLVSCAIMDVFLRGSNKLSGNA